METDITCDLAILGGGPGGYVCAIRAAKLGLSTVLIEKENLGGTCLNVGCIPSKAVIHAADEFHRLCTVRSGSDLGISASGAKIDFAKTTRWKDGIVEKLTSGVSHLLAQAGVRVLEGQGRFEDGKTLSVRTGRADMRVHATQVVIATGSRPQGLPGLPFGKDILSSTQILALGKLPKSLAVVGAGYIGLELGIAFAKLGVEVAVIEAAPRILPAFDRQLSAPVKTRMRDLGIWLHTETFADRHENGILTVKHADGRQGSLRADKVLLTVGRKPVLDGWGRENLVLEEKDGFLAVDEQCRTPMRGIFAIGDVTEGPMLAHRAMAQGLVVAEIAAARRSVWDKRAVPSVCFTDPEIVSVGLLPEQAAPLGLEAQATVFPLLANGRALTQERSDGFVRVVARADNEVILGLQAVGQGVSELASEFSLALEMGATLTDVAATMHAHPSLGETVQEACLKALGQALHAV